MHEPNLYYFQDFSAVCLLLINRLISFSKDIWSFLQICSFTVVMEHVVLADV